MTGATGAAVSVVSRAPRGRASSAAVRGPHAAIVAEGLVEGGWLFALIITPLFFNISSSRIFEPDKVALLRSITWLMASGWAVAFLSGRRARRDWLTRLAAAFRSPLAAPVLLLVGSYLLASTFSVSPRESLFGSYYRLQGVVTSCSYVLLFAAVVSFTRRDEQIERLLTTVALTSLPIAAYAVLQRLGWDPLMPWDTDVRARPPASLGNPIFLGAYLAMSAPIVLGLAIARLNACMDAKRRTHADIGGAALYAMILSLDLGAVWLTQSRGPMLGLYTALACLSAMLLAGCRSRRLAGGALLLFLVPPLFLALLNAPSGPLDRLRRSETFGRLGHMLETRDGSVGVRTLLWNGAVDLMTDHPPLTLPGGGPDAVRRLRPLIGYGPESMGVAFGLVDPAALRQLEQSGAFVDRAHNETWDVAVTTGLVGVVGYVWLFAAIVFHALTSLGLTPTPDRYWYWSLTACCTLAAALVLWAWQGPAYLGLAPPLGIVSALLTVLGVRAARGTGRGTDGRDADEVRRSIVLASLVAAVLSHLVEINFGIATVATRTHFWVFAGLIVAVGSGRGRSARRAIDASPEGGVWRHGWSSAVLLTVILTTLGFDFLAFDVRGAWGLAPAARPTAGPMEIASSAVLPLFLLTWGAGTALTLAHSPPGLARTSDRARTKPSADLPAPPRRYGRRFWCVVLVAPLALAASASLLAGWAALAISHMIATDLRMLVTATDRVAVVVTSYAALLLLLLLALALVLSHRRSREECGSGADVQNRSTGRLIGSMGPPAVAVWFAFLLNLQLVHADIAVNVARRLGADQSSLARGLYERAVALAPQEAHYARELERLRRR